MNYTHKYSVLSKHTCKRSKRTPTNTHENRSVPRICTGPSSAAWHLLTGPNGVKSKDFWSGGAFTALWMKLLVRHLFKPLFDVCVCLQLELPASVGPVDQEKPLLGVHLFDQDGCFLVVPHLKKKSTISFNLNMAKSYFGPCGKTHTATEL